MYVIPIPNVQVSGNRIAKKITCIFNANCLVSAGRINVLSIFKTFWFQVTQIAITPERLKGILVLQHALMFLCIPLVFQELVIHVHVLYAHN